MPLQFFLNKFKLIFTKYFLIDQQHSYFANSKYTNNKNNYKIN